METIRGREGQRAQRRQQRDHKPRGARHETEEQALRRYATSRDERLLEELVERYRPLARSLAMRYNGGSEPLEDLVQVANLGLVKALKGFDPELGKPFSGYAVPTVLGELRRHFRDRVWNLRLPRALQEKALEVDGAVTRMTEELGRSPTVAEIAAELECEPEDVLEAMEADRARRTVSLDAPRRDEDEGVSAAMDRVGCTDGGYDRVESEIAADGADLSDRERTVLELRFGKGLTQRAIGEQLGVSQMQISRISRRALEKVLAAVRGE